LKASRLLPDSGAENTARTPGLRAGIAAAFMGGWADQKAVLLPVSVAGHAVLTALMDRATLLAGGARAAWEKLWKRPDFIAAFAIGLAFVIGWASYALYGLSVSPDAFIEDHLKNHIVRRMKMDSVALAGAAGPGWSYPTVIGLWREFFGHAGWTFAALGLAGVGVSLRRVRGAHGMLVVWFLIGAIGFSLVDWRQTKHLAHIMPVFAIFVAVFWASLKGWPRLLVGGAIVAAIVWNLWRIGLLMQDFSYIQPQPIW
jgi:hypothetical protein